MDDPLVDPEPQQPLPPQTTPLPTVHTVVEEPDETIPESKPQPAVEPHDVPARDEPAGTSGCCRNPT